MPKSNKTIFRESQLSCFMRWARHEPASRMPPAHLQSMKIEFQCKQCGKWFVRYAYDRVVRCEACRRLNRSRDMGKAS